VVTFYEGGAFWDELAGNPQVSLQSLGKRGRWDNLGTLSRLVQALKAFRPDVVHSYLVEPSIFGLLAGRMARVPAIAWGVRASIVNYRRYQAVTGISFRVAAALSKYADLIIANSDAGRLYHLECGYSNRRFITIPNGIDSERFRPSPAVRREQRRAWGVGDDHLLLGVSARLDPMKGHDTLLAAVALAVPELPTVKVAIAGGGSDRYAQQLRQLARDRGLEPHIIWLGEQADMTKVYPAFDIACSSSSFGEGFSNSIAEAMCCEIPCLVTQVGDSAIVVGDTGVVVPPDNPRALAEGLLSLARMAASERTALGRLGRACLV
jgi:glycosyltransferase involved in cell wall biosynthesis